jgi:protein-S-isoprenylcysteine O-methyltransferase Ste14
VRKTFAILGSAAFFVIAPVMVGGVIPWWIAHSVRYVKTTEWPLASLGVILAAAGALALLDSFVRFAVQGLGTPAPVFPTKHLVITGLYRYVRNPMYLAVISVILGQSLILGNVPVLEYGGVVWLGFNLFVLAYEEPTLRAKYGPEYVAYCAAVPRWIPRLSGHSSGGSSGPSV